jgi:glutathione S-transferase
VSDQNGDFVQWESNAIMQYFASGKPNAQWPDDARVRVARAVRDV